MITIKILTDDMLRELFINYDLENPYEKIDVLCNEIKYLNFRWDHHSVNNVFVCAFEGEELVGVAKLKTGGCDSNSHPGQNNWIGFISVRKGHFGKGIGKILVENLFKYASQNNLQILTSGYSMRGWLHLRKHVHNYAFKYGVNLNDPETKPQFYDFESYEGFEESEYMKLVDKFARISC